ncbi:MAG: RIO1 family regulatory kinase/ATPase [Planctomycetota bacterium]
MSTSTNDLRFEESFEPTFTGSRQERKYIRQSLGEFWEDRLFTDVLYRVQGGKEANVYCLEAGPKMGRALIAAKVFRPRMFRAMRNDSFYKLGRGIMDGEGKQVFDGRSLRALAKKTRYGKRLDTASWVMHEYGLLEELHEAGADVPKPIAWGPNVILMEFIGDEDGPAPILSSVRLDRAEAEPVFERILASVEEMLRCYRVHGDLSAYNVMLRDGEPVIIDFPQAVDAHRHPNAFMVFSRDIDRLCGYFTKQGVPTDPIGLAHDMWEEWVGFAR